MKCFLLWLLDLVLDLLGSGARFRREMWRRAYRSNRR